MNKATYAIYKPFGMLSQFTVEVAGQSTLADLDFPFPKDVYPIGRLDSDSEGLLLLSNDNKLNAALLQPKKKEAKTYWAQVEGVPTEDALQSLRNGVEIRIKKQIYRTLPATVSPLGIPKNLPLRNPPIRIRKNIPETWLEIQLIEGKNRQVRRMCAAVGFPVLRLVRVGFAGLFLGENELVGMGVGEVRCIRPM